MRDRRATARRRVFKAGSIEFDATSVDCTIRNLSRTGAAVDVVVSSNIPHEIILNFATPQSRHHSYIVWRKAGRVGIVFAQ